jgi:hypothetical protein
MGSGSMKNTTTDDSGLIITQNEDGTFQMEWDPMDKKWSVLNDLTPEQIRAMLMEEIKRNLND